jgi:peptidyl-prolyl cis-trans isomerase SurA
MSMHFLHILRSKHLLSLATFVALLTKGDDNNLAHAEATTGSPPILIDRIIAVVEDRPIFRSEVLVRARPYLVKLGPRATSDPKVMRDLYRSLTERMVDELLIAAVAKDLKLTASDEEVERGIRALATQVNTTPDALVAEAKKQGMTGEEFRDEIRRQVIEGKWAQIKVRPHVRAPETGTPEEKQDVYLTLLEAEKKRQLAIVRSFAYVEVRW